MQVQAPPALRKDTISDLYGAVRAQTGNCLLSGGFGNELERRTLKDTEGH